MADRASNPSVAIAATSSASLPQKKDAGADPKYIPDDGVIPVIKIFRKDGAILKVWLPGHPEIRMCPCAQNCGGYRFQNTHQGGCGTSCHHEKSFTGLELETVARRYVRRCPICNRLFKCGGGKSSYKRENAACTSSVCRLRWAAQNAGEQNRCAVCNAVCLSKITATTHILLGLRPDRIFYGGEHCVCPGTCTDKFRADIALNLRQQAREHLANPDLSPDTRRTLEERFGSRLSGEGDATADAAV